MQRFKKGEWSNQFSDKAIYYPQSSWLFCLSCVTLEVGLQAGGKARMGCSLGLGPVQMCLSSTMQESWVSGALEPWPAKWVLSQP